MAAYLKPDKVLVVKIAGQKLEIKQKIIPDGATAKKRIASWVPAGGLVKPNRKLNDGTGEPRGITIHNTGEIKTAAATNPAEQYTRATYPNGNMNGVVVHFYIWHREIWQNLKENEAGWHASDGRQRRDSQRGGGHKICGNTDTIAIEVIGPDKETEQTAQALAAYLLRKHGLNPATDLYTHNFFMGRPNRLVPGANKNCPEYILPHWPAFASGVAAIFKAAGKTAAQIKAEAEAAAKAEADRKAREEAAELAKAKADMERAAKEAAAAKAKAEAAAKAAALAKALAPGTGIRIKEVDLYRSSDAEKPARKISGLFYIYSNQIVNQRIRITNKPSRVGKRPAGLFVTGWIKIKTK